MVVVPSSILIFSRFRVPSSSSDSELHSLSQGSAFCSLAIGVESSITCFFGFFPPHPSSWAFHFYHLITGFHIQSPYALDTKAQSLVFWLTGSIHLFSGFRVSPPSSQAFKPHPLTLGILMFFPLFFGFPGTSPGCFHWRMGFHVLCHCSQLAEFHTLVVGIPWPSLYSWRFEFYFLFLVVLSSLPFYLRFRIPSSCSWDSDFHPLAVLVPCFTTLFSKFRNPLCCSQHSEFYPLFPGAYTSLLLFSWSIFQHPVVQIPNAILFCLGFHAPYHSSQDSKFHPFVVRL